MLISLSLGAAKINAYVFWAFGGPGFEGWKGKWAGHALDGVGLGLVSGVIWVFDALEMKVRLQSLRLINIPM